MTPDLSDERLVRTFAHELAHAVRRPRSETHVTCLFLRFCVSAFLRFRAVDEEAAADELADAVLNTLGPEGIARWAAALRRLACNPIVRESAVGL